MKIEIPQLITNNIEVNKAFRIAVSDIVANITLHSSSLFDESKEVIYAGIGYNKPWTRDASINVWNSAGVLFPEASKNTLISVLTKDEEYGVRVGGEYWDAIIWVTGAWNFYLYTKDREFLEFVYQVSKNTIRYFEDTEFDEELNLFRGPACYGDGVAAYPDIYAKSGESGIASFTNALPQYKAQNGEGCPMHTLSTNCLYYSAYNLMGKMENATGRETTPEYVIKAERLKDAINKHFWMEDKGYYRYIVDNFGNCEHQEGLGHSFAILFDVADEEKTGRILKNQYITKEGIACVWPCFDRYLNYGEKEFGRHSGTVWPHVEAFWADAATKGRRYDLLEKEFDCMTKRVMRDGHFAEIYHPETGEIYGGVQEFQGKGITTWISEVKQTWSATGYIRMILFDVIGLDLSGDKISVNPNLISGIKKLELKNITLRNKLYDICVDADRNVSIIEKER